MYQLVTYRWWFSLITSCKCCFQLHHQVMFCHIFHQVVCFIPSLVPYSLVFLSVRLSTTELYRVQNLCFLTQWKSVDVESEVELTAVWEKAESRSQRGGVRVREQGGKHRGSCDRGFTLGGEGCRSSGTQSMKDHTDWNTWGSSGPDQMDQRRISSPQQPSTAREGMVKSGKNQTLVPDASGLTNRFYLLWCDSEFALVVFNSDWLFCWSVSLSENQVCQTETTKPTRTTHEFVLFWPASV